MGGDGGWRGWGGGGGVGERGRQRDVKVEWCWLSHGISQCLQIVSMAAWATFRCPVSKVNTRERASERARERECVCVREREREGENVCVREREGERERGSVRERERESVCA